MSPLYGLIPAAGKGTRARPYTSDMPKSMLEINGVPNLQRNIELMRDQLGIQDIVLVTGYLAEKIEYFVGDGRRFGVRIHCIRNTDLDRGLAWSILLGRQVIDDSFCVMLSDECYVASNHQALLESGYREAIATCAIKEVDDRELIRRNYSVHLSEGRITRLIEKPRQVDNDILGCGTFLFSPELFSRLAEAFAASPNNYVEFITFLDTLCQQGEKLLPFWLSGLYVNINDRDSLARAKFHERSHQFSSQHKALLVISEGCEDNVGFTLDRYRKSPYLDSIHLVVPRMNWIMEEATRQYGVQLVVCPPGCDLYGDKIRYALDQVEGDVYILTEADYAFPERDIEKLLAYLKEADMVLGTRTTRQLMEQGTDLGGVVRLANVFVAKLLELFWWHFEGRFTDVGCTFRAFWRSSYQIIREDLHASGPEFSAEMIIAMLNHRLRVLEIPVNYHNVSRALHARYRNPSTFFRFLALLLRKRFFFR